MTRSTTGLYLWLAVFFLSGAGNPVSEALAGAQSKPDAKSPAAGAAANRTLSKSPKPFGSKPSSDVRSNLSSVQSGKSSEGKVRKTKRHKPIGKKARLHATVQVKPDLSYHGILEQPQRYDPSPGRHRGAPNPQAGEVLHEHFQELDKNRDGMIDPFERALGRLDIDRDLTNRQP